MGSQLEQVKMVCCQLDDKRVNIRKKAHDQLRDLLNNSQIVATIDRVSVTGSARDWTWQDVYRSAYGFLKKEADKLLDDLSKESKSRSAHLANNKKITAISLFKMIIKTASKYLSWSSVVSDLVQCLEQPFMRKTFAEDIMLLLVEALNHDHSRAMLTVTKDRNQWEQILDSVLTIFEDPPPSTNPLIAAQLLRLSLEHGSKMTCLMDILVRDRVWRVLESALTSLEFAKADSEARLECVLAANAAMNTAGLECREAAVRLGEAAIRGVIPVWDLRRPGVKDAVIEFLLLQVVFHHPGSVAEVREGAMYADRLEWTRQLSRIQKNIIDITIRNKMRQNKQKNSRIARDYYLSPELVRLGAEVVYQLDKAPTEAKLGEVTQLVELDETLTGKPGPAAKRRRLSGDGSQASGLDSLVTEILKSVTLEEMKIPWLQILAALISRHTDIVRGHEETILELLSSQMSVTKSPAVRERLCGILASICVESGCGQPLWAGLAHTVLTLLGGNQLSGDGHRLLRALLCHYDSVKLKPQDVFNVFRNKLVKLDVNSARTLATLITKIPINDVRDPGLREDLMSWILSQLVSEHNPLSDKALVPDLSILIKHLTHKDIVTESTEEADDSLDNPVLCRVDKLEQRLRIILCITPLCVTKNLDSQKRQPETKDPKMMASADQLFISAAGHILETLQTNKEQTVRAACHFLHLLASYLSSFSGNDRIKSLTLNVFNDVQKALSKLINLKEEGATEKYLPVLTSASAVMDSLNQTLLGPESNLSDIFVAKLKEIVEEISKAKKALDARPSSRPSSRSHSRGTTPDPFLDDLETMDSCSTNDDFADFDMASQNNPEKDLHDIKFICESLKTISVHSMYSQDQASTQTWVIKILMEVLSLYDYNIQITEAFCTINEKLVVIGMTKDAVEQTGELLKDIARNCMSKTSFKRHGMFALTRCIKALIPLLNKFDVQTTRNVSVKIVETLIKQNSLADDKRLDDGMLMNLINVMEELSVFGVEASWAEWSVHHLIAPDLAVNTDEKLPIIQSLPGFLLSKYSSVRILTGQVIVKLADKAERKGAILKKRLLPVIESNRLYGATHSALLAALGCLNLTFAVPVISTMIRIQAQNRTGFNNEQLHRAVDLVKSMFAVDVLKASLSVSMEEYLRSSLKLDSFPISLFGYQKDQLVNFIMDNESDIVPLILLQDPKMQTLEKIAALFKKSTEAVMRKNFAYAARYFLPGMVAQDGKFNIDGKDRLEKLANFVESLQIPDEKGNRSDSFVSKILSYLKATIGRIFLAVNDPAAMAEVFKIKRREHVPAYPLELTGDMPSRVMKLLGKNTETNIWEEITVINSDYMANIAIGITSTLSENESAENNLRSVFSLYLWIDSLSEKFTEEMIHFLWFLVKYVSCNLLKLLNYSSRSPVQIMEDLSKAILLTLFKLLKFSMEIDASSIQSSLKNINYGLVNCLNQSSWTEGTSHIAVEVITFLLIQNGSR